MIEDPELYALWRDLVNLRPAELRSFLSEFGQVAGLSRAEAAAQGIKSGRESATWILRMKAARVDNWTPTMWEWAARQVNFIRRMRGNAGPLYRDGAPTRKLLALLLWGHDPDRYDRRKP